MIKYIKISLTSVLVFLIVGCTTVLLKFKGVTKPKFETTNSIKTFISKYSMSNFDGIFVPKDSTCLFWFFNNIHDFPSVDFFDSKGISIEYSATGRCTQKAFEFASNLNVNSVIRQNPQLELKGIEKHVKSIQGNDDFQIGDFDFVVLIYCAKYFGKLNKDAFEVAKAIKGNKSSKIKLFIIDIDYQLAWEMDRIPEMKFQ